MTIFLESRSVIFFVVLEKKPAHFLHKEKKAGESAVLVAAAITVFGRVRVR